MCTLVSRSAQKLPLLAVPKFLALFNADAGMQDGRGKGNGARMCHPASPVLRMPRFSELTSFGGVRASLPHTTFATIFVPHILHLAIVCCKQRALSL